MFNKRTLPALFLMASVGGFAAVATSSPDSALAGDYCAKFKKKPVKDACKAGADDEKKMRKQMKDWQKAAKEKSKEFKDGAKIKCSTCHKKSNGGELNGDAGKYWDEFEKLSGM